MSAVKKKKSVKAKNPEQLELYRSPEFQFKYWESSLFNETYLRNDLHSKHEDVWNSDSVEFQNFFDKIKNLFHAFDGDEKDMNNWTETETINLWVKEVLNALGWDNKSQGPKKPYLEETSFRSNGRTYRTDILIVDMPDEAKYIKKLKGDEKVDEAKRSVLIPVEVKYWNRLEQFRQGKSEERKKVEKKDSDELSLTTSPNEQTTKYMEMLNQNWGILTDGARWRLFNKELSVEEPNRFFEFNLFSLFQSYTTEETEADRREIEEAAKYFFHFFSKSSLFPEDHAIEPFPNEILRYSKKYISHVEENLKDRFIDAMNFACNGFYQVTKENKIEVDLTFIRSISESCLFNILFTKSLESRGVLPMNTPDYRDLSLSSIVDKIDLYDPMREPEINLRDLRRAFKRSNTKSFDYSHEGIQIHDKIVRLAKIIHDGNSDKDDFGFEIAGFKESVFDKKEWSFFTKNKLPNSVWVDVLFQLGYAESDLRGRKFQQIPYAYFTPRQLGSIYEGFLEYQLDKAKQDMVYENKQWKTANFKSKKYKSTELPKVSKESLFFTPDNKDRKATGSYYTPDYIVNYIVEQTLEPLVNGRSSNNILQLKVCDPAMGSGHFLVGALNYMTVAYLKALSTESKGDLKITQPEAKRRILDSCIFGVDINPRAVKLASMSLWLESAFTQHKLERLSDQLICGNLLLNENLWPEFPDVMFDAFVQNPPYIGEKGNTKIFSLVKRSWLGRYYQAKMDYFYFFVHASLLKLKPGGRVGMITTSYFLNATGAKTLRKFIHDCSQSIKFIDFKSNRVFPSATGQHNLISVFEKSHSNFSPEIDGFEVPKFKLLEKENFKKSLTMCNTISGEFHSDEFYISLHKKSESKVIDLLDEVSTQCKPMGDVLNVHQGIVSGGDKVTNKHIKDFTSEHFIEGSGIFVLSKNEFDSIKWSAEELVFLKDFYKNSDVGQFSTRNGSDKKILFLPKSLTEKKIAKLNNIFSHLLKYKKMLVQKRKKLNEREDKWFTLNRGTSHPDIFEREKIVAPQRSSKNTFGYSSCSWYASADVYFITEKDGAQKINLKAICGILNSKLYFAWLYFKGKRKGEMLELYRAPLSEMPIPEITRSQNLRIEELVCRLINNSEDHSAFDQLNVEVYQIFKFTEEQIDLVEAFYGSKFNKEISNNKITSFSSGSLKAS